ncbi:MAG: hypothetical protein ABDH23_04170 [Endomicrobiia bacterium]
MLKKYVNVVLLLYTLVDSSELPRGLMDIFLGQDYKNLKQKYQLKRSVSDKEIFKTYEIIYTENYNLNTLISFFNNKVFKITIIYNENFINEDDWSNIYNQALINYGKPNILIETKENFLYEYYIWEDKYTKHTYIRVTEKGKFKNFYIILMDKNTEEKINNLSSFKKILLKITDFLQ